MIDEVVKDMHKKKNNTNKNLPANIFFRMITKLIKYIETC